ncbi:uncharacterized protein LOC144436019 [Glandiceps talaboti]
MTQTKGSRKRSRGIDEDVDFVPTAKRLHNGLDNFNVASSLLNGNDVDFNGVQNQGQCQCMGSNSVMHNGIAHPYQVQKSPGSSHLDACGQHSHTSILHSPPVLSVASTSHDPGDSELANQHYGQINQILREAHFARIARLERHDGDTREDT